jgi:hypothetical protein
MANLTIEKGLVEPVSDASPNPGHDVVVLRVKGNARYFHSIVTEDAQPSVLSKLFQLGTFETYAVDMDPDQRLQIQIANLKSADHLGPFSLDLAIAFHVVDSQLLVKKLRSDPLRRLEREIEDALAREAKRMEWSKIADLEAEFERRLLSAPVIDNSGKRVPSLSYLQGFAKRVGLELKTIQVSRYLPEKVGKPTQIAFDEAIQREEIKEKALTEKLNRQLKGEIEVSEAEHRHLLEDMERLGMVRQGITDNLNKILTQIADKIVTFPELRRAVEELRAIRQELLMLPSLSRAGEKGDGASEVKRIGDYSGSRPSSASQGTLHGFLSHVLFHMGELACEPRDRDRLLCSILRLLGEVALLEEANPVAVEDYVAAFEQHARRLTDARAIQTVEQRTILEQLREPEAIRAAIRDELDRRNGSGVT